MRKRARVVMIVVAVAFIAGFLMSELWRMLAVRRTSRGPQRRSYVGQVGKHIITYDEYRNATSYITDKYKSDNQLRDLSDQDYASIENQTWQFLVSELTWAKVLKNANIRVTQDEVFEIMKANPPEELRDRPELMTDGKFDQEKYLKVMNAPENRAIFSKYFRDLVDMLPKEKFRIDILASYRVTQGEAQEALKDANTVWKATSLYFGPQVVKEKAEPTDVEVRTYYDKHKDDFLVKETRQLRYVLFPLATTPQDSQAAKDVIDHAYAQLKAGETFNVAMLDFSDLEAETSGTLFAKSRLDPSTDSILGKLKPGSYSPPFLTTYGWQIVVLDSIRRESVALRRVLVRVKQSAEMQATIRDSVRGFIDKCATENFDTLVTRFGLTAVRMRPMVGGEADFASLSLEGPSQLTEWARHAKAGTVMETSMRGRDGYYVFQLAQVSPAGVQPFEKVKPALSFRVRQEKEKAVWLAKANAALAEVKAGKALEQYAQENPGVELMASETYSGLTDARRRRGPEFAGALSDLSAGEKCGVIETNWGAYIIRCDERTEGKGMTADEYTQQRQQQVAQDLMGEYLKEPEVKDYRDAMGN